MNQIATQYFYDTKGMRIIKDGPYGKSIYVDTGYVESASTGTTTPRIVSNHVFVGNTRVASVVKHKDEAQAATYYYANDHLGSSSVLTTQTGSYHERIEYLPYGEVCVNDASNSNDYTTPYKFIGKELDKETNLNYFGARYYDARLSRWISTDPALQEGKYFPKPNDFDTEHDFYWYILNDASGKLPGMGGVYNSWNLDVYCYALHNPIKVTDPDGQVAFLWHFVITYSVAREMGIGFVNSLKLAWYAMMWDFREGSQRKDRWDMVNSHAMVGYNKINKETQEISEALQGADNFITSRLNTAELKTMLTNQGERNESSIFGGLRQSPLQDVGEATHTAVDKATKVHAGQPWEEFTLEHLIGDIFLSNSEIREAKQNVRDVLARAIEMGILRREDGR